MRSDLAHSALVILRYSLMLENGNISCLHSSRPLWHFINDASGQGCINSPTVNFHCVLLTSENQTGGPCSCWHPPCDSNLRMATGYDNICPEICMLWENADIWVSRVLILRIFFLFLPFVLLLFQKHLTFIKNLMIYHYLSY